WVPLLTTTSRVDPSGRFAPGAGGPLRGLLTFLAQNAEPIKLAAVTLPLAGFWLHETRLKHDAMAAKNQAEVESGQRKIAAQIATQQRKKAEDAADVARWQTYVANRSLQHLFLMFVVPGDRGDPAQSAGRLQGLRTQLKGLLDDPEYLAGRA